MPIYLLKAVVEQHTNECGATYPTFTGFSTYGTAHGFVVRAGSEQEARLIAREEHCRAEGDFDSYSKGEWQNWIDPQFTTCREITPEGGPEVFLMDWSEG